MSDLRENIYQYLDDNDWGWRRDGTDEIISMVLDSAIEAVKTHAKELDQVVLFPDDVEEVIEKLKEKE